MSQRPIPADLLALVFRQLSTAAKTGFPLQDALAIVREDGDLGQAAPLVAAMAADAARGEALSASLARMPGSFPAETVALLHDAETGAKLADALELLAGDYERRAASRTAKFAALAWPAVLFGFLFVLTLMIMIFVIPSFKQLYASFGANLPAPTILMIAFSELLVEGWWGLAILCALGVAVWRIDARRSLRLHRALDRFVYRVPFLSDYLARTLMSRLCALIDHASRGELPMPRALAHLRATVGNLYLADSLRAIEDALAAGASLATALRAAPAIPRRAGLIIELGERSANLGAALAQAAALSDLEAGRALVRFERAALIFGYLILGVAVGFIVIATYLPIFRMGAVI
ncbi:MAG: type II secretion system F family protein [Betaproteobacteria bacterium]|nr:type II secretion system F family protein [Betaproteobacteria bacterium]